MGTTRASGGIAIIVGGAISVALGVAFAVLPTFSERFLHPIVGVIAVAAVYAMPAVLGMLGRRNRPALVLAAAILSFALVAYALSVIVYVLAVAGACFLVGYARMRQSSRRGRDVVVGLAVVALMAVSVPIFFAGEDPRCWALVRVDGVERVIGIPPSADGSIGIGGGNANTPVGTVEAGCASDVVTTSEGAGVLTILAIALGIGLAATRSRGDDGRSVRAPAPTAPVL
jgi:hypothetical protein